MHPQFKFTPLHVLVLAALAQPGLAQDAERTEDISVFGQGQTRQVENISREDMAKSVPGTSPLKVLEISATESFLLQGRGEIARALAAQPRRRRKRRPTGILARRPS